MNHINNDDYIRRSDVLALLRTYNNEKIKATGIASEDIPIIMEIVRECPATLNHNGVVIKTAKAIDSLKQNIKKLCRNTKQKE